MERCGCINILTEVLNIPDLATLVCSYIPKKSDKDLILVHLTNHNGHIYFSRDDSYTYKCPIIGISIWTTRPYCTILVEILRVRNDIKLLYKRSMGDDVNFSSWTPILYYGEYDSDSFIGFMRRMSSVFPKYPKYASLEEDLMNSVDKYIKSITCSHHDWHMCDNTTYSV